LSEDDKAPLSQTRTEAEGSDPGKANTDRDGGDPLIGAILDDRWRITRKLAQGGMGAVYEAQHTTLAKRAAVKVLLDKHASDADVVARLRQEARLASSVGDPHIVEVHDVGLTRDGRTFIAMELLVGSSLSERLASGGRLAEREAISVARQIAGALAAAHGKGIVHRDVKPANILLVERDGAPFVKVVDFGISKVLHREDQDDTSPETTQAGIVLGTPLYMSPEQARGADDVDHRADVYALGVVLYELVTGKRPFDGRHRMQVVAQVLEGDFRPPSAHLPGISPVLEDVIVRAMAKRREARYQTMAELEQALTKILDGRAGRARLRRWLLGAALAALAGVIVGVAVSRKSTPPPPKPPAEEVAPDVLASTDDALEDILSCPPTNAKPSEDDRRAAFERGISAFGDKQWADAKRELKIVYCMRPMADVLFNIGVIFEKMHAYDEAAAAYEGYLAADPFVHDMPMVIRRITASLLHVATVHVVSDPPSANVTLRGTTGAIRGVAGAPILAPGGRYQVVVSKEGYVPAVQQVLVRSGEEPTFTYKLRPR
jgi:serine/threonine protein kinase